MALKPVLVAWSVNGQLDSITVEVKRDGQGAGSYGPFEGTETSCVIDMEDDCSLYTVKVEGFFEAEKVGEVEGSIRVGDNCPVNRLGGLSLTPQIEL